MGFEPTLRQSQRAVFKTATISHSVTPPQAKFYLVPDFMSIPGVKWMLNQNYRLAPVGILRTKRDFGHVYLILLHNKVKVCGIIVTMRIALHILSQLQYFSSDITPPALDLVLNHTIHSTVAGAVSHSHSIY